MILRQKGFLFILAVLLSITAWPVQALADEAHLWKDENTRELLNQYRKSLVLEVEKEIETLTASRSIGFTYRNIVTGDSYSVNGERRFSSASTTKTPVVLCVYQMAVDGKLDLDEELTYTSGYYYEGSGIIRYEPVGSVYTIRILVEYAVHYSDNIAYNMLKARIGDANLMAYVKGLNGVFSNNFNSHEIAVYLQALYDFAEQYGELGQELLGYFVHTQYEERIPAALPEFTVAHKVGMLPLQGIYHDSALVYDETPYIVVIMTFGQKNNDEEFFHQLTGLIHKRHNLLAHDFPAPPVTVGAGDVSVRTGDVYYSSVYDDLMLPISEILNQMQIDSIWDEELQGLVFAYGGKNIFIFSTLHKIYVDAGLGAYGIEMREGKSYVSASFFLELLHLDITVSV